MSSSSTAVSYFTDTDTDNTCFTLRSKVINNLIVSRYPVSHSSSPENLAPNQNQGSTTFSRDLDSEQGDESFENVIRHMNTRQKKRETLISLQEWEGCVTSIDDDIFTATLVDKTVGNEVALEEADFPISDLSGEYIDLLKIGAIFRWTIGYLRTPSGTKRKTSDIVFRRLPQWSNLLLKEAEKEAKETINSITWS